MLALLGCDSQRRQSSSLPQNTSVASATHFDPTAAGVLRGRVTWSGDVPEIPSLKVWSLLMREDGSRDKWQEPNPNAPVIDRSNRGVGNAVVFLRGVDPARSRPWDHAAVRVELRDRRFHVFQGAVDSLIGFVHRGDPVEMISRDQCFHAVHASGAAFFTLAFPDPVDPCFRCLNEKGLVELSSAAGFFAARAYLFMDDHPYFTRTDVQGHFVLDQVPPGRYEVVCWVPNWTEALRERDPETNLVNRLFFRPGLERIQVVTVAPRATEEVHWELTTAAFDASSSPCRAPRGGR
jgi:hypothetical protein